LDLAEVGKTGRRFKACEKSLFEKPTIIKGPEYRPEERIGEEPLGFALVHLPASCSGLHDRKARVESIPVEIRVGIG
jgi:hypothetical protein